MTTIWGAERFDFHYVGLGNSALSGTITPQTLQCLSSASKRGQAPLWFSSTGINSGVFADTQATFDAEIDAAVSAGLKFWAFLRYGVAGINTQVTGTYGLSYYQASSKSNLLNWCSILQPAMCGSTGSFSSQVTALVTEFNQSNYQKVKSGRPLVFIYWNPATALNNWTTNANFAAFITALRSATVASGLPTPYIVVQNGLDTTVKTAIGADAIGTYSAPGVTALAQTWTSYETAVEAYWASMLALGQPMVPTAMMGSDPRAIYERPMTFYSIPTPHIGKSKYVVAPTTSQITAHLTAGVAFINANPTLCDSTVGLIYAWNEYEECGAPLCPTLNDPTGTRCTAVGAALIGN